MNRYPITKLSRNLVTGIAVVVFSFLLASCGPPKPEAPLASVSLVVLDRFDDPIPDLDITLRRQYHGETMFKPHEDIADATTDADGKVELKGDLRVKDWVDATSKDSRYRGSVKFKEVGDYTLRLNTATGFGLKNAPQEDFIACRSSTVRIAAYHIKAKEREFGSLKHYVTKGAIRKSEADRFLKIAHMMGSERSDSCITWVHTRLHITGYNDPIQWVPYE